MTLLDDVARAIWAHRTDSVHNAEARAALSVVARWLRSDKAADYLRSVERISLTDDLCALAAHLEGMKE